MKATQVSRLVAYLREHPGSSGIELVHALSIPKYTSRISDARKQGYVIDCSKDERGVDRYTVQEARVAVTTGEQVSMALAEALRDPMTGALIEDATAGRIPGGWEQAADIVIERHRGIVPADVR